jgi:hypothetical protein
LEVLSELVLSEVGSERADFVTGDIPGAVAKVTSACRYWVERCFCVSLTKFIECSCGAVVGLNVELFGPCEVVVLALVVLVTLVVP